MILCWVLNQHAPEEVNSAGKEEVAREMARSLCHISGAAEYKLCSRKLPKVLQEGLESSMLAQFNAGLSPCCPFNKWGHFLKEKDNSLEF